MQREERTPSITSLQDPPISHIATNDTNWLQNITLNSSEYPHPPPKLSPLLFPPSNPTDEANALDAHLWDRQHASDLSAYEWDSSDLASSIHSSDDSSSDEELLPRLARRDEFEQGIQREETWTRAYRERWEEPAVFYKRKIQLRLEAEEREYEEGRSFISDDGWGAQVEQGWDTPATSGVGGWDLTSRSAERWSGVDGWAPWEKEDLEPWIEPEHPLVQAKNGMEDLEPWNRLGSPLAQEVHDTTQNQGCGETDDNSGEPPLLTQKPSRIPIPRKPSLLTPRPSRIPIPKKSTHSQTRSNPIQYHPTSSLPTAHHTARPNTISNPTAPTAPTSPTAYSSTPPLIKPSQPNLIPTASDPNPIALTPFLSTPEPPLNPTNLNTRLKTCIFKSLTLLAAAHQALHSTANIDNTPPSPISCSLGIEIERERQREREKERERAKDMSIERKKQRGPYTPSHYPQRSHKGFVVPATDIVRVEGWWKVKGRERWNKVGGRSCEEEEEEEDEDCIE